MRRFLTVPTAILTVVLLIAGCTSSDDTADDETTIAAPATTVAPPETATTSTTLSLIAAEIDHLLDDYVAAVNAYDGAAFRAVITDGYMYYGQSYVDPLLANSISGLEIYTLDADGMIADIEESHPGRELQVERLGELIVSGDGPWLVSQTVRTTTNDLPLFPGGVVGPANWTVVDEDGTLKVARNVRLGFGVR
jgi:hypothetical protein